MTLLQPQQTRQRRASACSRHPSDSVTGVCASCLRERLSRFDPAVSFPPELRRCRSLSDRKCGGLSSEPRRRSCDVRPRQSLLHLFNLDDQRNGVDTGGGAEVATRNLGIFHGEVFESTQEREGKVEKIRVCDVIQGGAKTMKEYIDLEWQSKREARGDLKDIAASLLVAASVFSKKLGKWKQKQQKKQKQKQKIPKSALVTNLIDKQLEIGGFGRRSCDAARVSLDASMYSFDEPKRASWDGHSFIGLKNHVLVEEPANFKMEMAALELDEAKSVSIAQVSPRIFHRLNVGEVLRASRSQCVKDDDCTDGQPKSAIDGGKGKELKNYHRWRKPWSFWGSVRRGATVKWGGDEMCCYRGNGSVESLGKQGGEFSREGGGACNGMLTRSKSCVAPRNHRKMVGSLHCRSGVGSVGHASRGSGKKRRQPVLETMHSPGNHENGLLRFYITPLKTHSRNKSNKNRLQGSRSTAHQFFHL